MYAKLFWRGTGPASQATMCPLSLDPSQSLSSLGSQKCKSGRPKLSPFQEEFIAFTIRSELLTDRLNAERFRWPASDRSMIDRSKNPPTISGHQLESFDVFNAEWRLTEWKDYFQKIARILFVE